MKDRHKFMRSETSTKAVVQLCSNKLLRSLLLSLPLAVSSWRYSNILMMAVFLFYSSFCMADNDCYGAPKSHGSLWSKSFKITPVMNIPHLCWAQMRDGARNIILVTLLLLRLLKLRSCLDKILCEEHHLPSLCVKKCCNWSEYRTRLLSAS